MSDPVFIDTSALYAVLDADDDTHEAAAEGWERLLRDIESGSREAITHYGVVVETTALVQRRLGMAAVRHLHDALLPVLSVVMVDEALHARAVAAMLAANRRGVSLVDWTSFELMRAHGMTWALTFDDDFTERGLTAPEW